MYTNSVENYREGGKRHQRIIANLGNLRLQKKTLVHIIEGLRRLVDKLYVMEEEISPQNGPECGRIAAGIHLRRTYRRASFLTTRLLANMGIAGSTPLLKRFRSPVDASAAEKRRLEGLYMDVPEEWDDPYRFFRW